MRSGATSMVIVYLSRSTCHPRRLPFSSFSFNSTAAYKAPPISVRTMPTPFAGVIVKSKIPTAHRIVRTCFTLAITRETKSLITDVHCKTKKSHTSHAHSKGTDSAIRVEADYVEKKSENSIEQQPNASVRTGSAESGIRGRGVKEVGMNALEFSGKMCKEDRLDECERGEEVQEMYGV